MEETSSTQRRMEESSEVGQGPEGAVDGMEMEWRPTLTFLTARNALQQSAKYKYNIINIRQNLKSHYKFSTHHNVVSSNKHTHHMN